MPTIRPSPPRWLSALFPLLVTLSLLATGAAWAADSPPNHVLRLNGDGDYVHLPGGIFNDFTEATVETWMRWDDYGYYTQLFAFGADEAYKGMGFNHSERSSQLQFFIYDREQRLYVLKAPGDRPPASGATWPRFRAETA